MGQRRGGVLVVALAVTACNAPGSSSPTDEDPPRAPLHDPADGFDPETDAIIEARHGGELQDEEEVVYRAERTYDANGDLVEESVVGELTPEQWRRAARPWTYLDDPCLYGDSFTDEQLDDGGRRTTTLFTRRPNDADLEDTQPAPPKLDPDLARAIEEGADEVDIIVRVAGFPRWDIPLRTPAQLFDETAQAEARATREEALIAREDLFQTLRGPVEELIVEAGGEVANASWLGGWLATRVPAVAVERLVGDDRVRRVALDSKGTPAGWNLGAYGPDTRVDTDQFTFNGSGVAGNFASPVGIIEPGLLDDETCFHYDGAGCGTGSTRLLGRKDCNNPIAGNLGLCDAVSNLADEADHLTDSQHATAVASVMVGDYSQGQGDPWRLGDENWSSPGPHASSWEAAASTPAREADFYFTGRNYASAGSSSEAIEEMALTDAVAINNSYGVEVSGDRCNPRAYGIDESIEDAYDEGKLVVFGTGNNPDNSSTIWNGICDVTGEASLPKSFAVPAVEKPLLGAYTGHKVSVYASGVGGATLTTPDSASHSGAGSLIALAATHGQDYHTDMTRSDCSPAEGSHGVVRDGVEPPGFFCGESLLGSSFAAPVVTGAASLVHYWLAAQGHPSIDAPGRLFAAMLSMGDSHYEIQGQSATVQRTTRSDVHYGLGRLKARKPPQWMQTTVTFTSSTPAYSTWIDPSPMPSGTAIVKCVAQHSEDMSAKSTVSDIDLSIELYTPVGGACSVSGLAMTRTDDSYDVKSMVTYRSPTTLAGKCARVRLTKDQIAGPSISAHLFCYRAEEDDDEPN